MSLCILAFRSLLAPDDGQQRHNRGQQTRFKGRHNVMLAFKNNRCASITWFSTGTAEVFITARPGYRLTLLSHHDERKVVRRKRHIAVE